MVSKQRVWERNNIEQYGTAIIMWLSVSKGVFSLAAVWRNAISILQPLSLLILQLSKEISNVTWSYNLTRRMSENLFYIYIITSCTIYSCLQYIHIKEEFRVTVKIHTYIPFPCLQNCQGISSIPLSCDYNLKTTRKISHKYQSWHIF